MLDRLVSELAAQHSIVVGGALLNFKVPSMCIEPGAQPCAVGDARLKEENWQALIANVAPSLSVWQDTEEANMWMDGFGAAHDDLMVYDRGGKLFSWLGSRSTLGAAEVLDTDLVEPEGYAAVRATLILAARASPQRCSHVTTLLPWHVACATHAVEAGTPSMAQPWAAFALLLITVCGYALHVAFKKTLNIHVRML